MLHGQNGEDEPEENRWHNICGGACKELFDANHQTTGGATRAVLVGPSQNTGKRYRGDADEGTWTRVSSVKAGRARVG
jgi:hypothetical protein